MTEEAVPRLSFGSYRMGQPVQVDIHDPVVAGLVKAGYLTIRWKEPRDGADPLDSAGPGHVSADRVDSGAARETAQVDVEREHRSGGESSDSPQFGFEASGQNR